MDTTQPTTALEDAIEVGLRHGNEAIRYSHNDYWEREALKAIDVATDALLTYRQRMQALEVENAKLRAFVERVASLSDGNPWQTVEEARALRVELKGE